MCSDMLCDVLICHVMSCHVMSCHVMSCHVMSCHVLALHVTSCHVMSCPGMACHVMSCHAMSCHVMLETERVRAGEIQKSQKKKHKWIGTVSKDTEYAFLLQILPKSSRTLQPTRQRPSTCPNLRPHRLEVPSVEMRRGPHQCRLNNKDSPGPPKDFHKTSL